MIRKYIFGSPIETGAVVGTSVTDTYEHMTLMDMVYDSTSVVLSYTMEEDDVIYGLGQQVRGINKRGYLYISNATDDPNHIETKHSLYGAHNFLIVCGKKTFGIFIDDPGQVSFDVGYTAIDSLKVTAGGDCVIYTIEGSSLKDIVKQFRKLIGQSYAAPKWAFGYQQSRWGYKDIKDVRRVISGHHDQNIPLEAVCLDIDYMERYKDFTVDREAFPDFEGFVAEVRQQNVHLVPIIDAGVKIEEGYDVYEEGVKYGYFCKDEDGNDFVAAVWPGKVHFPDVLNSDARKWFGGKYRWLIEQGIDGFWNDMNEPAIFYSQKQLDQVFDELVAMRNENLDINSYFHMKDIVSELSNSPKDYRSFYHNMDGRVICHDKVHNLFGYNMTKAASEAFDTIAPDRRILMYSRSSYIGMHRYGGIWTGDNQAWWQQLLLSIQQMPSLNMCGILYTGSDIGGFGGDTTPDLLMRWLEFGLFTPLMRNHAAAGTREKEVYQFDRLDDYRNIIRIRYSLMTYIYSEFMKSVLDDEMYFRPVAFDYPDDRQAYAVEDQLMVGESIMIAPVYTQNAKGRYVYLPEEMMMVRMKSPEEKTCEMIAAGHHYIPVALNEIVIFIKKGHLLPMIILPKQVKTMADVDETRLEWLGAKDDEASYVLYTDDGISKKYTEKSQWKIIKMRNEDIGCGK